MPNDNIEPPAPVPAPAPAPAPAPSSQEPRWALWILILFAGVMLVGMLSSPHIIQSFADPAIARGAITFLIGVATIGIAFTLIYQAFYAPDPSDDRFRRGREVFAGMMGVLGTIVGFYFGSSDRDAVKFAVAEIRIEDGVLRTHVAGGTPPFRYSIESDAQDFTDIRDKVSDDGWIRQKLPAVPAEGVLIVRASDSRGRRADAEIDLSLDMTPPSPAATDRKAGADPSPAATPESASGPGG
jgi:hypothetical protein